jgi:hypothetical protein
VSQLLLGQEFVAVDVVEAGEGFAVLTLAGDVLLVRPEGTVRQKLVSATSELTDQYLSTAQRGASALARDGATILAGTRDGQVLEFDLGGTPIGTRATGLKEVTAVDRRGGVLAAAEARAGKVCALRDGQRIEYGDLQSPDAVALFGDDLYVIETGRRRLVAISLDAGTRQVVAEDLPVGMPVAGVHTGRSPSLAVGDDGSVVCGCDGDGSILRFRR